MDCHFNLPSSVEDSLVYVRLHPEDGGSMDLQNVNILPHHYPEDHDVNICLYCTYISIKLLKNCFR